MPMQMVRHIALDVLHGVVNGHASRDGAAGAVDIKRDIGVGVIHLQKQQLRHDDIGYLIGDFIRQKDDAILQKAGIQIIAALAVAGAFYYIGDENAHEFIILPGSTLTSI